MDVRSTAPPWGAARPTLYSYGPPRQARRLCAWTASHGQLLKQAIGSPAASFRCRLCSGGIYLAAMCDRPLLELLWYNYALNLLSATQYHPSLAFEREPLFSSHVLDVLMPHVRLMSRECIHLTPQVAMAALHLAGSTATTAMCRELSSRCSGSIGCRASVQHHRSITSSHTSIGC